MGLIGQYCSTRTGGRDWVVKFYSEELRFGRFKCNWLSCVKNRVKLSLAFQTIENLCVCACACVLQSVSGPQTVCNCLSVRCSSWYPALRDVELFNVYGAFRFTERRCNTAMCCVLFCPPYKQFQRLLPFDKQLNASGRLSLVDTRIATCLHVSGICWLATARKKD
jgi:hypothetical protein